MQDEDWGGLGPYPGASSCIPTAVHPTGKGVTVVRLSLGKHWLKRRGWVVLVALATAWALSLAPWVRGQERVPFGLKEVLNRMDRMSKRLKTLSASLEYTKVTVLVDDHSTESGEIFLRHSSSPQILIRFEKPDRKTILFKKNSAEIYIPKINQIQEYDLKDHQDLLQQFLLLGFGTRSGDLRKSYNLKLAGERVLDGDAVVVLELVPKEAEVAARLEKVTLWVSEESWLPVQQRFHEPNGDYVLAKYTSVKVNRYLPGSKFRINANGNVTRLKMTN